MFAGSGYGLEHKARLSTRQSPRWRLNAMKRERVSGKAFFFGIFALLAYATFVLVKPFLNIIMLAVISVLMPSVKSTITRRSAVDSDR